VSSKALEGVQGEIIMVLRRQSRLQSGSMRKMDGAGKYTFSRILGDQTSQQELFGCVALPMVRDVLEGRNCLLFTYGVTNAGKTYTILVCPWLSTYTYT
jgi:hypothetical protein